MQKLVAPLMPGWLERQLPFERYCVGIEGRRMHVMEAGGGLPVLLVHGNPTWGYLYRKVATQLLDQGFRVIMPDLIGLGFSDKPLKTEEHTLANHARWLSSLIDQLQIPRLILCVQDWGGPIGVCANAHQPERIAGMVVLNTTLSEPKPNFRPTTFHRFSQTPVLSDIGFRYLGLPQKLLWAAQGSRTMGLKALRAYRYPLRSVSDRVAPLALARMVPDTMNHLSVEMLRVCKRVVQELRAPTAIVWGDGDPVLGSVRTHIERLLPDAPVTRTNAGHFLQEEVPTEIANAIRGVAARANTLD